MCGIALSTDTKELQHLTQLNTPRGTRLSSITYVNLERNLTNIDFKGYGQIDPFRLNIPTGCIGITHQAAPTGCNEPEIHPAEAHDQYLWHNGLIKQSEIKRLQFNTNVMSEWDTRLLLESLVETGIPPEIEGSFACIWLHNDRLYTFRNNIAPLYYGARSISSMAFEGSNPLQAGVMYGIQVLSEGRLWLQNIFEFPVTHNPYQLEVRR